MPGPLLRIATFNAALEASAFCKKSDQALDPESLAKAIATKRHPRLQQVANIIKALRPDILLLNEFDWIAEPRLGIEAFCRHYLESGANPLQYPWYFVGESNTGQPIPGFPGERFGFGAYPGQYGMALLSRYPIEQAHCRTFQHFRWAKMPGAMRPMLGEADFYPQKLWEMLRLSSKSHWDLRVDVQGKPLHLLASHPTPPVFDGPEKANQKRNFDEIRFWADYLSPGLGDHIEDDSGVKGGLVGEAPFVVLGDLNADPDRGDSHPGAIDQLLSHPLIDSRHIPISQAGLRRGHGAMTADWGLRADYVLPSKRGIKVHDSGVYWPEAGEGGRQVAVSDHRLVWLDIELI